MAIAFVVFISIPVGIEPFKFLRKAKIFHLLKNKQSITKKQRSPTQYPAIINQRGQQLITLCYSSVSTQNTSEYSVTIPTKYI